MLEITPTKQRATANKPLMEQVDKTLTVTTRAPSQACCVMQHALWHS